MQKNSPSARSKLTPSQRLDRREALAQPLDRERAHAAFSRTLCGAIRTARHLDQMRPRPVGDEMDGLADRGPMRRRHDPQEMRLALDVEHMLGTEVLDEADHGRHRAGGRLAMRVDALGPDRQRERALRKGHALQAHRLAERAGHPQVVRFAQMRVQGRTLIGGSPMNSATKRLTGRW